MTKMISLAVLVGILLVMAGLFFYVMADFLLPLFLALLLVVIFRPLYHRVRRRCRGHDRLAAALTTASILLIVLIPLLALLVAAGYETQSLYHAAVDTATDSASQSKGPAPEKKQSVPDITEMVDWATGHMVSIGKLLHLDLDRKDLEKSLGARAQEFLGPMTLRTTQFLGGSMVGLLVMLVAIYYFFADGRKMVRAILRLSPLEGNRTQELLDQFDEVTRAVVAATLLAAFAQGLLAGLGFYVAGTGSVFLLTFLCMLFSLVPFVGGAIVWVPVCVWLFAVHDRTAAALALAAYCIAVVGAADNLVKPWVLHGRSNIHPLLALLSVLGGAQALGAIGLLVGPMVVAFLQTLLEMVHTELNTIATERGEPVSKMKTIP